MTMTTRAVELVVDWVCLPHSSQPLTTPASHGPNTLPLSPFDSINPDRETILTNAHHRPRRYLWVIRHNRWSYHWSRQRIRKFPTPATNIHIPFTFIYPTNPPLLLSHRVSARDAQTPKKAAGTALAPATTTTTTVRLRKTRRLESCSRRLAVSSRTRSCRNAALRRGVRPVMMMITRLAR